MSRTETLPRAGIDPISSIHVMEDHDGAYRAWHNQDVKDRILVHFDGHLDFYWIAEHSPHALLTVESAQEFYRLLKDVRLWNMDERSISTRIHIGNFIYPAIRDGHVKAFYWVVPDSFWNSAEAKARIILELQELIDARPADAEPMAIDENGISLHVLGRPLRVCPMSALPRFEEPVLLDIDVDYLVTVSPLRPAPYFDSEPVHPWLTPRQFLRRIQKQDIPSDLVTIAYSVNGGYTPLRYKYFGDWIRAALSDPHYTLGDGPFRDSAAEAYHAFLRASDAGGQDDAQRWWQTAVKRDASYRTPYAFAGFREELDLCWEAARVAYSTMVEMDPDWYWPYLSRGRALWHLRDYSAAAKDFQRALTLSPGPTIAKFWLGRCALRERRYGTARDLFTAAAEWFPDEPLIWKWLALTEARLGSPAKALDHAMRAARLARPKPSIRRLMSWASHVLRKGETTMNQKSLMETCFERQSTIVTRKVAGEVILVPIAAHMEVEPALYTLDSVAGFLWEQLEQPQTGSQLCRTLQDNYEVHEPQAQQDVEQFLNHLLEIRAIHASAGVSA